MTLDQIIADYRPYETMPEFWEGFENSRRGIYRSPYDFDGRAQNGVKGQAWDRGANAAMRAITAGLLLRHKSAGAVRKLTLSSTEVVGLFKQMQELERTFCIVAFLAWITGWLP
jgi:hypothetical protein